MAMLKEKKEHELDAPETTMQHREIVLRKKFLRKLYADWYKSFLRLLPECPEGKVLEIGSGGGFLKSLNHQIITSDILPLPYCDMTFPAEHIPFDNNSVAAVFMLNVLHHIPDSKKFFSEAQRVLEKDGILFMIEPASTPFSRFIYTKFHHEPFNPDIKAWAFEAGKPLSYSNQALPTVIFRRDIDLFHKNFPDLHLQSIELHTPFSYLLTGGLSFKSLVPGWSFGTLRFIEKLFKPFYGTMAMFQTIVVKKH